MHAQDILGSIASITGESDTGYRVSILRYLNKYYKQLEYLLRLPELIKDTTIPVPAFYNTGTATTTKGSTSIVGSGTTWGSGYAGWYFKLDEDAEVYRIASSAGATAITLESAYIQASGSAKTYKIWKSEYTLPADFNKIISATQGNDNIRVQVRSIEQGDALWSFPYYKESGSPRHLVIYRNVADYDNETTTQLSRAIIMPVPDDDYQVQLKYWRHFTKLTDSSSSYPVFDDARMDEYLIDRTCARVFLDKEDSRTKIYYNEAQDSLAILKQYFEDTAGDDDRFLLETGGDTDADMITRVSRDTTLI